MSIVAATNANHKPGSAIDEDIVALGAIKAALWARGRLGCEMAATRPLPTPPKEKYIRA